MSADDEQEAALRARASARLGAVLRGKYRLDRVIGVGGMASVYAATHRNQAEFAVKVLHPELSAREDIRKRFLREGYLANSVKHPGAVLVVDDDVAEDGSAFLVMELLQGTTVEDLSRSNGERLPVGTVSQIALQLLDVLAVAHANGIVHRDLKPANLFLMKDGSLKVLDFGIARIRDGLGGDQNSTASGTLLGTPAFIAPEQALARAEEIDAQTDIFSVGATMFTLVSGQLVHDAANAAHLVVKAATEPARSLLSVVPDVPEAIARVVDTALSFEKSARFPSAQTMATNLRAACEPLGPLASRESLAKMVAMSGSSPSTSSGAMRTGGDTRPLTPRVVIRGAPESGGHESTQAIASSRTLVPESAPQPIPASRSTLPFWGLGVAVLAGMIFMGARMARAHHEQTVDPHIDTSAAASTEPATIDSSAQQPPVVAASAQTSAVESARAAVHGPAWHPKKKPDCSSPYTLDENQNKHWKRECVPR